MMWIVSQDVLVEDPNPKNVFEYYVDGQVELRYLRDFLGITAGVEGMTTNPVMSFSGVIGSSVVSLGTDLAFDTILRSFTKCNAGLSFSSPIVSASITLWVSNT